MNKGLKALLRCLAALALVAMAGCSSVYMKGTPLYTGEYSKPQGPAENRVNLWPLAYYHDPALSLLWPLGSFTEDHFAIRPLFTIYKLDKANHEYNVLWPIAQFDADTNQNRVFPILWWGGAPGSSNKYFVTFPLFWCWGSHQGSVFDTTIFFPLFWYDRDDYVAFFPLYIRSREPGGSSTHILWPIFNVKTAGSSPGWRLWPFYGQYASQSGSDSYRFALWPLLNQWRQGGNTTNLLFPLYLGWREGDKGWDFVLPLYLRTYSPESNLTLTPLFGRSASANSNFWVLPCFLSWYTAKTPPPAAQAASPEATPVTTPAPATRDFWGLAGLIHSGKSADAAGAEQRTSHFIPFYYRDSAKGLFLSLPYSRKVQGEEGFASVLGPLYMQGWNGEDSWRFLFPLLYQQRSGEERTFVTPLVATHQNGETKSWILSPLASWLTASGSERDLWFLGPLAHARWGVEEGSSHFFPIYYYSGAQRVLATLLFWYSGWGGGESLFISPLYMASGDSSNGWRLVPPLFFSTRDANSSLFISLLYARSRTPEHRVNVVPPLLSWEVTKGERRDWWILGGLSHARSQNGETSSSHFFPLYYRNRSDGTFVTPLFGWAGRGSNSSGATYVGGPLFVYAWNASQEGRWFLLFPFISGSSTAQEKSFWFWPLGSYNREKAAGESHGYAAWPLFWYSLKPEDRKVGMFPIFYSGSEKWRHQMHEETQVERSGERSCFLSLPAFWYWEEAETVTPLGPPDAAPKAHRKVDTGLWPLWHYKADERQRVRDHDFSIVGWLYDYRSRERAAREQKSEEQQGTAQTAQGGGAEDYVRSRVLWRVMHYERLNGQSSLDLFPFITYDARKETRFRKFSFIWRFVRYERTDEGGLKLDVLFIPLHRP